MNIQRAFKGMLTIPVLLVGFLGWANGQEEKLVLNPPLSQIFPLDPKPDGMRLKFPILLNERTILGPNVILRFIYVDPNASLHPRGGANGGNQGGGDSGGHGHHHGGSSQDSGSSGGAYSRGSSGQGGGDNASDQDTSDTNKGLTGEALTEVWTQVSPFRGALEGAADMGTTLVYSVPGKQKPQSTMIDLPDGMFLAEIDGHVKVLALTSESKAFRSGLRPEDEIRSFEGHPTITSLNDFLQTYLTIKEETRKSGKSYSIEVWRPSASRLETIQVAPPPSLPSLF